MLLLLEVRTNRRHESDRQIRKQHFGFLPRG
jgi:hypothetical protein